MASEQWKADIGDLADLYRSKDKSLDRFSQALCRFQLAWVAECRLKMKAAAFGDADLAQDIQNVTHHWTELGFAIIALLALNEEASAPYIVAEILFDLMPRHRQHDGRLMIEAKRLSQLSDHLRKQPEVSRLIAMAAQSVELYSYRLKTVVHYELEATDKPYAA